jgi:integrase
LRANEVVNLTWGQVKFGEGVMKIYRSKHGRDATHRIPGAEMRDLRRIHREAKDTKPESFVFVSRLGGPMTTRAFARWWIARQQRQGYPMRIRMPCATPWVTSWRPKGP